MKTDGAVGSDGDDPIEEESNEDEDEKKEQSDPGDIKS